MAGAVAVLLVVGTAQAVEDNQPEVVANTEGSRGAHGPLAALAPSATSIEVVDRPRRPVVDLRGTLTPNQLTDGHTLTAEEALAACGPAAAVAFARAIGERPTLDDAVAAARLVGWTAADGMAGPRGQVHLLAYLGVGVRLEEGEIDWAAIAREVQAGTPAIVIAPGHYFVAERYDPGSGRFDFGQSAAVLRAARGQRWFAPADIAALGMGVPRAAIHLNRAARDAGMPEDRGLDPERSVPLRPAAGII